MQTPSIVNNKNAELAKIHLPLKFGLPNSAKQTNSSSANKSASESLENSYDELEICCQQIHTDWNDHHIHNNN